MTTKLTPSTDLQNIKRVGLGWEMLDSAPGAFVVLEECSHSAPYEIGRFDHNGTAKSRANAFREAQTLAGSRDKYNGERMSFNTYEETAEESAEPIAPASRLVSSLNLEEARTVANTARLVRQDIRKKYASLKGLRAIKNDSVVVNPYHADRRARRLTPELWNMIRARIGDRVEATCAALLDLEQRADQQADSLTAPPADEAPLAVGDRVNDGGVIRHVTTVRTGGAIVVIDNIIELTAHSVQRVETCRQICDRIAKTCGISADYAFQAFTGAEFDENAAIAAVKRAQDRHASADAMALDFIASTEEPATDIYRLTYPEIIERMQIERAQPCGTKPTARGFMALMIGREQAYLPPDVDTVRDVLQSQLVNVYQHGIITAREWQAIQDAASTATQPRPMLEALRVALLRGLDIAAAISAATK
ncbi:TPA: hypothetical protein ACITN2_004668 [Salmonella enterica subsp. enterica serovar Virchow]